MIELTPDEREHIRLVEEYRAELQRNLGLRRNRWAAYFMDKIALPVSLLVLTALLSGLVIPYILKVGDDQRQTIELKSRIINDIVGESAVAQMAVVRLNEQMCDYWNASLQLEARKKRLQRQYAAMSEEERRSEYTSLSDDRRRENDLRVTADRQYAESRFQLIVSTERLKHTMALYYRVPKDVANYIAILDREHDAAESLVDSDHQDRLAEIFKTGKAAIATCNDDNACRIIVDAASTQIDAIRSQRPTFSEWQMESQKLAAFVANTEPSIGPQAALAGVVLHVPTTTTSKHPR